MNLAYIHCRDIIWTDMLLLCYKDLLCQMSPSIDQTVTVDQMRVKLDRILADDHYHIYLAFDGDYVVATCTLLLEETFLHNCALNAHLENIVVDSGYRGKGIAYSLIEMAIGCARQAGAYKIILDCIPELEHIYAKNGFEIRAVQMRLDLDH